MRMCEVVSSPSDARGTHPVEPLILRRSPERRAAALPSATSASNGSWKVVTSKRRKSARANGARALRILVDRHDLRLARRAGIRGSGSRTCGEIEDVEAPKTKMPPGVRKWRNLSLVGPVMNGLQVDLAEVREIAGGEKLWDASEFPSFALLVPRRRAHNNSDSSYTNCQGCTPGRASESKRDVQRQFTSER